MYTADMSHREAQEWVEHFAAEVRRSDMPQSYRQRARQDLQDCQRRKGELVRQQQGWYCLGPQEGIGHVTNEAGLFDHYFHGNAVRACHWLHDIGVTDLRTEVGELQIIWNGTYGIDEEAQQAIWDAQDWESGFERLKLLRAQAEDER